MNKTLELKICDLGFARTTATIGPNDIGLSREAVTQYWRAPEVELSVGGYTKAIGKCCELYLCVLCALLSLFRELSLFESRSL